MVTDKQFIEWAVYYFTLGFITAAFSIVAGIAFANTYLK